MVCLEALGKQCNLGKQRQDLQWKPKQELFLMMYPVLINLNRIFKKILI